MYSTSKYLNMRDLEIELRRNQETSKEIESVITRWTETDNDEVNNNYTVEAMNKIRNTMS